LEKLMTTMSSKDALGINKKLITGAAVSTPLNSDFLIDHSLLISHVKNLLSRGIDVLTLFGTTGEGVSFSIDERNDLIKSCKKAGILSKNLGSGIFALHAKDAGKEARFAFSNGCGHVLLTPPSFYKGIDDEGLYRWYSEAIEAMGSSVGNIILYNIPALTHVELSVKLVLKLSSAFPGVVTGVKDSSGNWTYSEQLIKERGVLKILIGHEGYLHRGMLAGASGAIAGTANIIPEIIEAIVNKGSEEPNLIALIDELLRYPIIAGVKAMIAHRQNNQSWSRVRAPLISLTSEKFTVLNKRLDSLFFA